MREGPGYASASLWAGIIAAAITLAARAGRRRPAVDAVAARRALRLEADAQDQAERLAACEQNVREVGQAMAAVCVNAGITAPPRLRLAEDRAG